MFDFSEDNTMDINTPIGSKVRFSFLENGNYYDVEKAKKYLKKNEIYTKKLPFVELKNKKIITEFLTFGTSTRLV